ncbi:phosphomannomutase/phosphoglucomutase [Patescibacteria group bacterium]|nr:phosphomannomutase/phosphoglucomutase [Patescibacteria group bacterium]MBU4462092.1 phosphomannomutase/phosphoglucomutase [Patescibacteria group bacterium]MCG2700478.1 phosphomannomutase/phosphoglucomutase [Candidatus Parcubacteria bacterium]
MIDPEIFRSYDIRGIYPDQLNEDTAYLIGKVFVNYIKAKELAVGYDMRLSSPVLFKALRKGITEAGCNVYDLGQVPTEMIYFVVGSNNYSGGIMITASHNPKEYNGLKLVRKANSNFLIVRGQDIYGKIKRATIAPSRTKGKIKKINLIKDYVDYISSFFDLKETKPFKIVIDTGNGMAAKIIPLLEKKISVKIIPLNFKIDGNFPSHPSNPLEESVTQQISKKIIEERADFGFIFDGDADRIFLIDEKGNLVGSDVTILLLAKYFLQKKAGAGIVYNTICSKSVPELVEKWGGNAVKSKVGFVNVREKAIESNAMMGGELSGHYCFKDNFYGDSSLMALFILLQVISKAEKKVSELAKELTLYSKASEINFEVEDKDLILNKIKEKYSSGRQEYLDGVTVEYDDWYFNLRPSNTEPLLRLTIEANKKELLEEKKKEITDFISSL